MQPPDPEALFRPVPDEETGGGFGGAADEEQRTAVESAGGVRDRLRDRLRPHRAVERWVPETLRDTRVDPGGRGTLLLTLVAAVAALAAAVGVWRGMPEPRPVQAVSPPVSSPSVVVGSRGPEGAVPSSPRSSGAVSTPVSADAGPAVLAVSVTGRVRRPGLVRVPRGSRVADAVAAAGGVTAGADLTGLNLATLLADGDAVVVGAAGSAVPTRPVGSPAAPTAGADPPVDLNTADSAALEELPGVGPVMAGDILAWREQHGPFTAVEQLQEVPGIGPARYARLAPLVTVGAAGTPG